MEQVRGNNLLKTLKRKYADPNGGSSIFLEEPGPDEPENLRQLNHLLVEFCERVSPEMLQSSTTVEQDVPGEAVDEIVRHHLNKIGRRFDAASRGHAKKSKPEPSNRIFLEVPKVVTTLSAISDWPSTPKVQPSLKSLTQNVLINDIRQSLVGAKASAAFCCGGSVAFSEGASEQLPILLR